MKQPVDRAMKRTSACRNEVGFATTSTERSSSSASIIVSGLHRPRGPSFLQGASSRLSTSSRATAAGSHTRFSMFLLLAMVALLAPHLAEAFTSTDSVRVSRSIPTQPISRECNGQRSRTPSSQQLPFLTPSTPTRRCGGANSQLCSSMSLQDVSEFYATYPLQSAILTCGFKASIADSIAQFKDHCQTKTFSWEARRNTAYIIYGGLFIGLMCHAEYNILFPLLFGTEHTVQTIAAKVVFDDFVSAPLMWLPPAYLIKAMVYDYSLEEGLSRYWRDIRDEGLLWRYWSIWVPAQTISFSVVPDHLRVAFMASISFFWFILFSSVSSGGDSGVDDETSTTSSITAVPVAVKGVMEASLAQPIKKLSFESMQKLYHAEVAATVLLEAEASHRATELRQERVKI